MLLPEIFHTTLKNNNFQYFTGVPDSTLKEWLKIVQIDTQITHRIASNEGSAIAHASGYYLATGKIGTVYMQNSGIGNAINPLTSLVDKKIFNIPILLIIGWRGADANDEPQHKSMGKKIIPLLSCLGLSYQILDTSFYEHQIQSIKTKITKDNKACALIIKKGVFSKIKKNTLPQKNIHLSREEAISTIISNINDHCCFIATTGKISRELFELQKKNNKLNQNFFVVGSMGHASAIAMEIACQKPDLKIILLDGDGSVLMHMGNLATIGFYSPSNLVHIVLDNGSYDSTGGQLTFSNITDFAVIAKGCGYANASICLSKDDIVKSLSSHQKGPLLLILKVKIGSRSNLGRPDLTTFKMKDMFMKYLSKDYTHEK